MTTALPTLKRNWLVTMRAYHVDVLHRHAGDRDPHRRPGLPGLHAIGGGRVGAGFAAGAGTADYLGFVTVGAAALMFTTRMVLWVAKAQITEQREGTLECQLIAPAHRLPYLLGVAPQALMTTVGEVAVMLAFALAIGVRLPVPDPVTPGRRHRRRRPSRSSDSRCR